MHVCRTSMIRSAGVTFAVIYVFWTALLAYSGSANAQVRDSFCLNLQKAWPEYEWKHLAKGVRLGPFDAIFTCSSSEVRIRSAVPFGESQGLNWAPTGSNYTATIFDKTLLVLEPPQTTTMKEQEIYAEIVEIKGEANYSTEHHATKQHLSTLSTVSREQIESQMQEAMAALNRMEWENLRENAPLEGWDMIRTGDNGRVEIEILKEGYIFDTGPDLHTGVVDKDGRPTKRKRFPANSYFILRPEMYLSARVTKVVGNAWKAADKELVRDFVEHYKTHLFLDPNRDDEAWQRLLREPELR